MTGGALADHHRALLRDRALSDDVIAARGYRTVPQGGRTELRELGFSDPQSRLVDAAPALLIPLWNTAGAQDGYQLRPDMPRPDAKRDGKPRKYEALPRRPLNLDAPPGSTPALRDAEVPLYVTEAPIKGDALAGAGAKAVVSMPGVWGWRGADAQAALDRLSVKGRTVYLIPDSDVQSNPLVRAAIWRLGNVLTHMRAAVKYVHLPHAPDGTKQGVDDWLAAGARLDDAEKHVATHLSRFDRYTVIGADRRRTALEQVFGSAAP